MTHAPDHQPHSAARQRVIDGASRCFIEFGYGDVSMQQIADEVGITKATLYHHFRDKEDLFVECMRRRFAESHREMAEAVRQAPSYRELLVAFAALFLREDRADVNRLMTDFKRHVGQEHQKLFWSDFRPPWGYLEEGLSDAMARGEVAPGNPQTLARMCFGAIIGTLQMHRDTDAPTIADADVVVEALMSGLSPR